MNSRWMSAEQAVEYLALPSKQALYKMVQRGVVPARRLGRLLRFSQHELDQAMRRVVLTLDEAPIVFD